jgi:hypothetical protein
MHSAMLAEPLKVTLDSVPSLPARSLAEEHAALVVENAALLENAALMERMALAKMNAVLSQENARLAEQNALLLMSSSIPIGAPPGLTPSQGYGQHPGQPDFGGHGMISQPSPQDQPSPEKQRSGIVHNMLRRFSTRKSGLEHAATQRCCGLQPSSFTSTASGPSSSHGCTPTGSFMSDGDKREPRSFMSGCTEDDDEPGEAKSSHQGPPTTVMMRNIPNNYTRELLLNLIDDYGFRGCYDLVYLPVDFKTEFGLGYSFINFTDSESAERFRIVFEGFRDWSVLSEKVCEVLWSEALQGVADHVERYRNSPVMHETVPDEFRPALFRDGQRIAFPAPTKKIRAPRLWSRRQDSS